MFHSLYEPAISHEGKCRKAAYLDPGRKKEVECCFDYPMGFRGIPLLAFMAGHSSEEVSESDPVPTPAAKLVGFDHPSLGATPSKRALVLRYVRGAHFVLRPRAQTRVSSFFSEQSRQLEISS